MAWINPKVTAVSSVGSEGQNAFTIPNTEHLFLRCYLDTPFKKSINSDCIRVSIPSVRISITKSDSILFQIVK